MSTGVVVTHAHRTAVGKSGRGTLRETRPDELLGRLIETFMERVPDLDPADVDDVIVGCAFPEAEQGMNVARIASLRAGLPVSVPGMTLNRFCSSGLQSLATGAAQIGAGWSKVVITGGVESMSLVPMGGQKPAPNPALVDTFPASYDSMGITSETVAERYDVSREDQDAFAVESNRRAIAAIREGRFKDEIVPIEVTLGGKQVVFDTDEGPRRDTDMASLGKLRPVFATDGVVTAGNASQMSDGAAATVVVSADKAKELGLSPIARLVSFAVAGVPPEIMGIGPVAAVPQLLDRLGLKIEQMDVIELNEAFAAQVLANGAALSEQGWDWSKVNVNGGGIALGHPIGASGARILVTLIFALRDRGLKRGIAALCLGGAEAVAMAIEIEG